MLLRRCSTQSASLRFLWRSLQTLNIPALPIMAPRCIPFKTTPPSTTPQHHRQVPYCFAGTTLVYNTSFSSYIWRPFGARSSFWSSFWIVATATFTTINYAPDLSISSTRLEGSMSSLTVPFRQEFKSLCFCLPHFLTTVFGVIPPFLSTSIEFPPRGSSEFRGHTGRNRAPSLV